MKHPFRRERLDRWLAGSLDKAALMGLGDQDRDELMFEARRRFDAGAIDQAKRLYRLANALFPDEAAPWIGLGACAQVTGDIPLAKGMYQFALDRRRGEPLAIANLAECALLNGDRLAARDTLALLTDEVRQTLPPELAARMQQLKRLAEEVEAAESSAAVPADIGSGGEITYAVDPDLSVAEFRSVLVRSTLAERRPINEPGSLERMIYEASMIVTARAGGLLVGVSRALTDYRFCTYLSDLAVDRSYQRRGIGRELIRRTHAEAGESTTLILLAAPAAREYYPHIGMTAHDSCWIIPRIPNPTDETPR